MKKLLFIVFIYLFGTSFASEKISYSGRLTAMNGAPLSGPVSLDLNIVTSTPSILCTINDSAVPLSNGVFHFEVDFGTTCSGGKSLKETLSDSIAASEELFIQVVDQTNSKSYPAQAITSTPLATIALEATSVTAGAIVNTSLSGIDANCANNEVMAADGSGKFKCVPSSNGSVTSITAGTGLTGGIITSAGTISVDVGVGAGDIPQLDGSGKLPSTVETDPTVETFAQTALPICSVDEVLKSNGTNLFCVSDNSGTDTDTTYTAGTGIKLLAGAFSIDASPCPVGERFTYSLVGFGCETTDATSLQGNDIDNSTPNDNDVLTWNNSTSKWEPQASSSTVSSLDDLTDAATTTDNVFLGHSNTMGSSNTGVGVTALDALTTGNFNTALGDGSLTATSAGSNNLAVGYNAGASNVTGSGNIFLGNTAGQNATGSNKLYIDNSNTTTPLIHGDFATDILTVNGQLKITGGNIGAGKVLTSDAAGLATWTSPSTGTVSSVSGSAPIIVATGTTTPLISISQASTSTDGYLSQADWDTFNNKQDALPTGGTTAQYLRGNLTLSTFLDDVLTSVLTGYSTGADTPLVATDSILSAFGKVQAQINDNNTDIALNQATSADNTSDIAANLAALSDKVDKTITVNGSDLAQDIVLDTDDVSEGVTNKYFTNNRAVSAVIIDSTNGTETDKAPSVNAVKSLISNQVTINVPKSEVRSYISTQENNNASIDSTHGDDCSSGEVYVALEGLEDGDGSPITDMGFCLEQSARSATNWDDAKSSCEGEGKRLPRAFEWSIACERKDTLGLSGVSSSWEWIGSYKLSAGNRDHYLVASVPWGDRCLTQVADFQNGQANPNGNLSYRCAK